VSSGFGAFARFCLVGVVGFVVDAGVTLVLTQAAGWPPLTGRIFAFVIAATVTWSLNRRFTFRSERGASSWGPYVMLTGVGAGINVGAYMAYLWLAGESGVNILTGVALGSVAALAFNFFASQAIFKRG